MQEQKIEYYVDAVLTGDAQSNASEFILHLTEQGMKFQRGKGYWERQLYWVITFQNETVCYLLINDPDEPEEEGCSWVVWSDDAPAGAYESAALDEPLKKTAWEHVDFCSHCGSCSGGTRKAIFEKAFAPVCRTTFRFDDPDEKALVFLKKMVEIRKEYIRNQRHASPAE